MRFIPTFCLKEDMLLGKNLYNNNGSLLLKAGTRIRKHYIDKIIELGFQGVYIDDNMSKDIEIHEVISDELRINTVQRIKDVFIGIGNEKSNIDNELNTANKTVEQLID